MEQVTDLVYFIIYKHFKGNNKMWKDFDGIKLDSCRYITDFGIQLLNEAIEKKIILKRINCCGCEKLFKSLYTDTNEKNDIFTSTKFTQSAEYEVLLNSYKLLIINDTSVNLISNLKYNKFEKYELNGFMYNYENIYVEMTTEKDRKFKSKKEARPKSTSFNIATIEVNKVCEILN